MEQFGHSGNIMIIWSVQRRRSFQAILELVFTAALFIANIPHDVNKPDFLFVAVVVCNVWSSFMVSEVDF